MKIWIAGTHGTGKSTILSLMEWVKINEIARSVIKTIGHPKYMEIDWLNHFQTLVLDKQISAELKNKEFISDRTVFDMIAYSYLHCDAKTYALLVDKAISHYTNNPYDIVFYLPIEFPLVADWIRFEDEKIRELIDLLIKNNLQRYNVEHITITGSVEERLEKINKHIKEVSF